MLIPFPVGYVSGILKQIPANIVVCALLVSIEVKMAATSSECTSTAFRRTYPFQNYTCFPSEFADFRGFYAAQHWKIVVFGIIPIITLCVGFVLSLIVCIIWTHRAISRRTMSPKLKALQTRFLRQLIFQAGIPLAIVCLPSFGITYVYLYEVFGYICE